MLSLRCLKDIKCLEVGLNQFEEYEGIIIQGVSNIIICRTSLRPNNVFEQYCNKFYPIYHPLKITLS